VSAGGGTGGDGVPRRRGTEREVTREVCSLRPPLSALFLLHIAISHALFRHMDTDNTALDASSPCSDTQRRLLSHLASDWLAPLLLLLTTAASLHPSSPPSTLHGALTFMRVLCVVPASAFGRGLRRVGECGADRMEEESERVGPTCRHAWEWFCGQKHRR
jgi:hypothetical protein